MLNNSITNPQLTAAIKTLQAQPNSETEKEFLDLLKNAQFLVPINGGIELGKSKLDGKMTLKKSTKIKLPTITDDYNNPWQIAFTDWPAFKKWRDVKNEPALILSFAEISAIILNKNNKTTGLIINPGSDNLPVPARIIAYLDGHVHPNIIDI